MSEPKKRGRKPINKIYFGPEQEDAVARFLVEEDYELRNSIWSAAIVFGRAERAYSRN